MPSDDAKFLEFPADDSQDFATGSRISQDFPRKSDDARHTTPTHTAEAWCMLHLHLVSDLYCCSRD